MPSIWGSLSVIQTFTNFSVLPSRAQANSICLSPCSPSSPIYSSFSVLPLFILVWLNSQWCFSHAHVWWRAGCILLPLLLPEANLYSLLAGSCAFANRRPKRTQKQSNTYQHCTTRLILQRYPSSNHSQLQALCSSSDLSRQTKWFLQENPSVSQERGCIFHTDECPNRYGSG